MHLINFMNQMNLALPDYLMLIIKCQMTLNMLYIPHLTLAKS